MSNSMALISDTREPQTEQTAFAFIKGRRSKPRADRPFLITACCIRRSPAAPNVYEDPIYDLNFPANIQDNPKKRLYRIELLLRGLAIVTSPAISTWRRLNPNRNGEYALQGCGRWPPIAGTKMTTRYAQFGPNMGFDVVECFSLQIQKNAIKREYHTKTKSDRTHGVQNSG
jgi:hypothetical protein